MTSPLFADLVTQDKPAVVTSDLYKNLYVGEGVITQSLPNGRFEVKVHGEGDFPCRPVFNIGENIFTSGIVVLVMTYNKEGWILGRMRAIKDEGKDDGEVEADASAIIGTEGDATVRPHNKEDKNITAEVTVTRGGVVRLKATGETNITLHPHTGSIIQRSQNLVAYTDAYRIESGRISGKIGGVVFDALTKQEYKTKVGPSRTEVRIRNGKVDGSTVHRFSVDTLATAAGRTTGLSNFKWEIDDSGNWQVKNCDTVKIGDIANEPIVLGNTLANFLRQELTTIMQPHNQALATIAPAVGVAFTALGSALSVAFPPVAPLVATIVAKMNAAAAQVATATAGIPALQATFLTATGVSKELILSDFFSTQKIAPVPGVIAE